MVKLEITAEMKEWAKDKAKRTTHSRTFIHGLDKHGDNAYRGHLGEAVYQWTWPLANYVGLKTHDFVHDNEQIEVKSRGINVDPQSHYWATVPEIDAPRIGEEILVFSFINMKTQTGFLVGWEYGTEFIKTAQFHKKGTKQPDTNMVYKASRYAKKIFELRDFDSHPVFAALEVNGHEFCQEPNCPHWEVLTGVVMCNLRDTPLRSMFFCPLPFKYAKVEPLVEPDPDEQYDLFHGR